MRSLISAGVLASKIVALKFMRARLALPVSSLVLITTICKRFSACRLSSVRFSRRCLFSHGRFARTSLSLSIKLPDLRRLRNQDDRACFLKVFVELRNPLLVTCKHLNLMEFVQSMCTFPASYSIARRRAESLWCAREFVHCLQQRGQRLRYPIWTDVVDLPYDVDLTLCRILFCHALKSSGSGCANNVPLLRHVLCALHI